MQDYLFDYFGSMGFSRARGPLSYVEAVFFYDFYVQVDAFHDLRGAIGSYFLSPGGPWADMLRVWGYPWADLVRSRC